ncbi:MAG: hypothetical protein IPL63_07960 [Saprospiraceae bacterium]|nr:hypothetical protein [Saprospiraceae bacterium]MBK6564325.1 hypothetical protein [Saprospiraceae bacterium]MBK6782496.1 hypothetical protein [Saprospiraceae bacterium]MBK7523993.1 hypothetical protein [Saprospiraceae bacterium]MBK8079040.1 hypothetical protein [Saprospiraceae bacterium]
MASFRIRPKFSVESEESIEEILLNTKEFLKSPDSEIKGLAMQDHITLRIRQNERHFWSPQLSVLLIPNNEKTRVIGVYGPMPNVWLIFTFSYLALSVLSVFVAIVGFSQYSLGLESKILWLLPFFGGVMILLYIFSQFGQKLGAEQMFTLHHHFEKILKSKIPIS